MMKKIIKTVLWGLGLLIVTVCALGVALAFWPVEWKIKNKGITPVEAAVIRRSYKGPHEVFAASDGDSLFLRRWDPDSIVIVLGHSLGVASAICAADSVNPVSAGQARLLLCFPAFLSGG